MNIRHTVRLLKSWYLTYVSKRSTDGVGRIQGLARAVQLNPDNLPALVSLLVEKGGDEQQIRRFPLALSLAYQLGVEQFGFIESNFSDSRSQLLQDIFVLIALGRKRSGYFVEIGVGDGEYLSNTWLLEKRYGWQGILAEPNPRSRASIEAKRSAPLDRRAVWSQSGCTLEFMDVVDSPELSTLTGYTETDHYERQGQLHNVETITLQSLLDEHDAPQVIDYLSIDTEGSEWDLLEIFDLSSRRINVVSIEHNHVEERLMAIRQKFLAHGYRQVLTGYTRFDAWFVHPEVELPNSL